MERPPKYVMILFPPCDLSLTPHMHGEEVSFHCLFSLFFVRFHRIWTALPSTQLLHSVFVRYVMLSCYHKMAEIFKPCMLCYDLSQRFT